MPGFDPDQFLAETAAPKAPGGGDFDPDKFLAQTGGAPAPSSSGDFLVDAAKNPADALGSVSAAADQLGRNIPVAGPAAVKAGYGLSAFLSRITPDSVLPENLRGKTLGELYDHFQQQDQDTQAKLMADHPVAAKVGQVGGAFMAPIPGAGMEGLAGAATRVAGIAGMNAADSALRGGDPGQAAEVGGGIAAGLETLPYVGKAAAPIADLIEGAGAKLSSAAERSAFKASAGNQAKAWDTAGNRVNEQGRQLLDNGIVTFGSGARTIAERAKAAQSATGKEMGAGLQAIDQLSDAAEAQGVQSPARVSGPEIAQAIRARADQMEGGGNQALVGKLRDAADRYEGMGDFPLQTAQTEKNSWEFTPGDEVKGNRKAVNLVKGSIGDAMESAIGRLEDSVGGGAAAEGGSNLPAVGDEGGATDAQGTLDAYKDAKSRYGAFAAAGKNATKLANRIEKNQRISLGDKVTAGVAGVAGLGAAAMHSPVAAVAAAGGALAAGVLRRHGDAMAAVGLDKIGSMLQAAPEAFGEFAQPLLSAQARGPQALAVTHYLLSQQHPDYLQKVMGQGEETDQPKTSE